MSILSAVAHQVELLWDSAPFDSTYLLRLEVGTGDVQQIGVYGDTTGDAVDASAQRNRHYLYMLYEQTTYYPGDNYLQAVDVYTDSSLFIAASAAPTGNTVKVTWSTGEEGDTSLHFAVQRLSGNTWWTVGTTAWNVEQFTDSGLSYNAGYAYRVAEESTGAISNQVGTTTGPQAPAWLDGVANSSTSVTLTWGGPNDGQLSLFRGTDPNFTPNDSNMIAQGLAASTGSFTDTGLAAGTQYFYKAANINTAGSQSFSTGVAITLNAGLHAPTNVKAYYTPGSNRKTVDVTFKPTANATATAIERSLDGGQTWTAIGSVPANPNNPTATQSFHDTPPAGQAGDPAPQYRAAAEDGSSPPDQNGNPTDTGDPSAAVTAADFSYFEDFENGAGSWSPGTTQADEPRPEDLHLFPEGWTPGHFLGTLNSGDSATLSLSGLPAHSAIHITGEIVAVANTYPQGSHWADPNGNGITVTGSINGQAAPPITDLGYGNVVPPVILPDNTYDPTDENPVNDCEPYLDTARYGFGFDFANGDDDGDIQISLDGLAEGAKWGIDNVCVTLDPPKMDWLKATDSQSSSNNVTASDASAQDLYILQDHSFHLEAGFLPDKKDIGQQFIWNVDAPNGDPSRQTFNFGTQPTEDISAPPAGSTDVVTAGFDANGNGQLDENEVERTIIVHGMGWTQSDELWWFNGETQAAYPNQIAFGLIGGPSGTITWTLKAGTQIATLQSGPTTGATVQTPGPGVLVKSTGASSSEGDVDLQAAWEGKIFGDAPLTVYTPKSLRTIPWAEANGSIYYDHVITDGNGTVVGVNTQVKFYCYDQFGRRMAKGLDYNEVLGPEVKNIQNNDWGIGTNITAHLPDGYALVDNYGARDKFVPTPVDPQVDPAGAAQEVNHNSQNYYIGSLTAGKGVLVRTQTVHQYRGYARIQ